jgi:hypothetical protein
MMEKEDAQGFHNGNYRGGGGDGGGGGGRGGGGRGGGRRFITALKPFFFPFPVPFPRLL